MGPVRFQNATTQVGCKHLKALMHIHRAGALAFLWSGRHPVESTEESLHGTQGGYL